VSTDRERKRSTLRKAAVEDLNPCLAKFGCCLILSTILRGGQRQFLLFLKFVPIHSQKYPDSGTMLRFLLSQNTQYLTAGITTMDFYEYSYLALSQRI
jgi:hypothetical protein